MISDDEAKEIRERNEKRRSTGWAEKVYADVIEDIDELLRDRSDLKSDLEIAESENSDAERKINSLEIQICIIDITLAEHQRWCPAVVERDFTDG